MRLPLARALVVLGIVAVAFNLRTAAVSVGPVLAEVRAALGLSALGAGVLTALPPLAFAVFGAVAPLTARRLGVHRTTLLALGLVVAGLLARATTGSTAVFLVGSVVALAGMAASNVLMPSLVKIHFPHRTGLLTGLYTTSLAVGLTLASAATVPVAEALGSWRWGLGIWAVVAAVTVLPWLPLCRHDSRPGDAAPHVPLAAVGRTRLGWAMALTFALQSLQAYAVYGWFAQVYRDAGYDATTAGLYLGLIAAVSIPFSFLVPLLAARTHDQTRLLMALLACYPVAYLGLALAPTALPGLWAFLAGTGLSVFPLVLTLIGLRSRTPEGTAALSGFTQAVGYALAALGPFAIGALYDATGGWTVPLVVLTLLAGLLAVTARVVSRPAFIEDQLASAAATGRAAGTTAG